MDDRAGWQEKGSGISVLMVRHDDVLYIYIYIYIYIYGADESPCKTPAIPLKTLGSPSVEGTVVFMLL